MKKRTVILGEYDTAARGWTLSGLALSAPEQKTNYLEKPGGDGSWDLSTVLSNGIPRYKNRTLTVKLECSKWDRTEREKVINELVNTLDGLEWEIVLPDRPDHYIKGRIRAAVDYSDLAHAAVTITGTCEPWLYSRREAVVELTGTGGNYTATIRNAGRRAVVPMLTISGNLTLEYNGAAVVLRSGSCQWANLLLTPGHHTLEYSGTGTLTITYREAVLR
jgi:hypothetical protein